MVALAASEVGQLDPYAFLAALGKRVIHPGGRTSTDRLLEWVEVRPGQRVLDIGCGVGITAIRLARECGAQVVAGDIAPPMRERANSNITAVGLTGQIQVHDADVRTLGFPDDSCDVVVAEAVTMFVHRPRPAFDLRRVIRPGGRILETEFYWRHPPTAEAKQLFLGEVCPGLRFDSIQKWAGIHSDAGLIDVRTGSGPFGMMTPRGVIVDEGSHALAVIARGMSRPAYLRKMVWLWPRMSRAVLYLGYVLVMARKPEPSALGKA